MSEWNVECGVWSIQEAVMSVGLDHYLTFAYLPFPLLRDFYILHLEIESCQSVSESIELNSIQNVREIQA